MACYCTQNNISQNKFLFFIPPRNVWFMELCLLHANCQGGPLARLLALSPDFAARWSVRHVINYTREPVPEDALRGCTLFLYQPLGAHWGELASERLLARLNPGAAVLRLPDLFFKGYWPLWTNASTMHFGDIYLDYLTDMGLELAEIIHLYMRDNLDAIYDLDGLAAESQARQRERERGCVVELADYVEAHWKDAQLFASVNHPSPELLRRVADAVLTALGLPPLAAVAAERGGVGLVCDAQFELPVHPAVGRHFGLSFVGPERRYPVYGKQLTFRQYALCYADCRRRGLNFQEYLAAVKL